MTVIITNLLKKTNGGRMKKKWCRHIYWCTPDIGSADWMWNTSSQTWVYDEYNFCPYCGKERPDAKKYARIQSSRRSK